jgi:hypothetical protein
MHTKVAGIQNLATYFFVQVFKNMSFFIDNIQNMYYNKRKNTTKERYNYVKLNI